MRRRVVIAIVIGVALAAVLGALGWRAGFWGPARAGTTGLFFWLLVLVAVALAGVETWAVMSLRDRVPAEHTCYTEDRFDGVRWRWEYDRHDKPMNFRPHCPVCDCELDNSIKVVAAPYVVLFCNDCNRNLPRVNITLPALKTKINQRVRQKIRSEQWRRVVTKVR